MTRRLIIIEPGGFKRGESTPKLEHGIGHWVEAIERFATWWDGPTDLVGNEAPMNLVGVTTFHRVEGILRDSTRPLRLRIQGRTVRFFDPLFAGPIGTYLLREDWERSENTQLIEVLEKELHGNPETTIFVPTAIAITAESLVRNARRLAMAAGGRGLRIRLRFSSQAHERRSMDPRPFALQLRRWNERASGVNIKFGVEVESMAQRYSAAAGIDIAWVPWPGEVTNCAQTFARNADSQPKFFLYSLRSEQGSRRAPEIARSISALFDGKVQIATQVGKRTAEEHPEVSQKLAEMPNVVVSPGHLPPASLHALFADASAIILPYDRTRYRGRGSALMWAALDHGIPMIAPAGTGFGDDIAHHGIGFSYRNLDEIPALCRRAVDEREALRAAILRYQAHREASIHSYFRG
jgi:hypothetical protein